MKTFTLSLILITAGMVAIAQQDNRPSPISDRDDGRSGTAKTHFSIGYQMGIPVDDFAETFNNFTHGIDMVLAVPLSKQAPIYIGADYSYGIMGGQSVRQRYIAVETDPFGNSLYTEYTGEATTLAKVHGLHGIVRVKSSRGPVQPYIDAMGGFRHFATTTRVEYHYPYHPSQSARSKHTGSTTWSYGAGFGLMFPIGKRLSMDVRGNYLLGKDAVYADPQSIQIDGNTLEPSFSTKSSKTNMATVTVGIKF